MGEDSGAMWRHRGITMSPHCAMYEAFHADSLDATNPVFIDVASGEADA